MFEFIEKKSSNYNLYKRDVRMYKEINNLIHKGEGFELPFNIWTRKGIRIYKVKESQFLEKIMFFC